MNFQSFSMEIVLKKVPGSWEKKKEENGAKREQEFLLCSPREELASGAKVNLSQRAALLLANGRRAPADMTETAGAGPGVL